MNRQCALYRLKQIGLVMFLMVAAIQTAGCSEVNVSGKTAADVFTNHQTLALVKAACQGDLAEIDKLVRRGANVNANGYRDTSVLAWVMLCSKYSSVKRLLELGANPNYKMEGDMSPMWLAAAGDDPKWLPLFFQYGGDPNIRAGYRTALMIAIENNRDKSVQLLLQHGADINEHDEGGSSAATQAAGLSKFDIVAMLLEHGYSYDLQGLALEVSGNLVSPNLAAKKQHVLDMLKDRGVKFPLPPPHIGPPPPGIPARHPKTST